MGAVAVEPFDFAEVEPQELEKEEPSLEFLHTKPNRNLAFALTQDKFGFAPKCKGHAYRCFG